MKNGLFQELRLPLVSDLRYQSYSFFTPSSISTEWCHPSACSLLTSHNLRIVPSGFDVSHLISPLYPTVCAIRPASPAIVVSFPVPIFMWQLRISDSPVWRSRKEMFSNMCTDASAISSLHKTRVEVYLSPIIPACSYVFRNGPRP